MHSLEYYILIFVVVAATGMYIANKKVSPAIRQQRWLKFFTYILITCVVTTSILLNFFRWLACVIVIAGFIELRLINSKNKNSVFIGTFIAYAIITTGFLFFSFNFGKNKLLFLYFQVLIFDAFCQITGQLFGKTLLIPRISPTKTIEGLIGGWLFCLIAAVLGREFVGVSVPHAFSFGLLTGLTSFCGDILASSFKRSQKIKDFSNWLPGQGGVLDRFDSFIFSGAVYWLANLFLKDLF